MKATLTKITSVVAACACAIAMILVSVLLPQQKASAADDSGSFTADGVNIPDYCGHNSVYLLSTTGEVYRAFVPSDGSGMITNTAGDVTGRDDDTTANATSAKCLIPMPYLPASVTVQYTTAKRRSIAQTIGTARNVTGKYNALGADTSDGTLWAAAEIDTSTAGMGMQVFRLDASDRQAHQSMPNPEIRNSGTSQTLDTTDKSYWKTVGGFIKLSQQVGTRYPNVFGGAVNPANHRYYVANLISPMKGTAPNTKNLTLEIRSFSSAGQVGGTKTVTIPYTGTRWGGSSTPRGDIEFDDNGNLTIVVSKMQTSDSGEARSVGMISIPASTLDSSDSITGSLRLFATPSYTNGGAEIGTNVRREISGIGFSGTDTSSLTVSMYDTTSCPTTGSGCAMDSALFSMNVSDANLNEIFALPQTPPYTQTTPSWGTSADSVWTLAKGYESWGGGSSYTQSDKSNDPARYYLQSHEIMDIAKGGAVESSKPYSGSYQFTKVDATSGATLRGAEFTLWPYDGSICGSAPTSASGITLGSDGSLTGATTAASDANGLVSFTDVPLGKATATAQTSRQFCLAETGSPDASAYELDKTPSIIEIQPSATQSITVGANVKNTRRTGSISWTKSDETDTTNLLPGSRWSVSYTPESSDTGTLSGWTKAVTDCESSTCSVASGDLKDNDTDAGEFTLTGLTWGKYVVTETHAPKGYDIPESGYSHTFYVGKSNFNGNASYEGLNPASNAFTDPRVKSGVIRWGKLSTKNTKGVQKSGDVTEDTFSTLASEALPGSGWTLYSSSDHTTITITDCVVNNENDNVDVSGCAAKFGYSPTSTALFDTDPRPGMFCVNVSNDKFATFTLEEVTHPKGYKLNTNDDWGNFTVDASHLSPLPKAILDEPIVPSVTWGKYSSTDVNGVQTSLPDSSKRPLAGSVWKVVYYSSMGPQYYATISDCVTNAYHQCTPSPVADGDGRAGVFSLNLSIYGVGKYALIEQTAPLGYQLDPTPHVFTVTDDNPNVTFAFGDEMASGPTLPMSGGTSTQVFRWASAGFFLLAILSASVLWIRRKGGARVK